MTLPTTRRPSFDAASVESADDTSRLGAWPTGLALSTLAAFFLYQLAFTFENELGWQLPAVPELRDQLILLVLMLGIALQALQGSRERTERRFRWCLVLAVALWLLNSLVQIALPGRFPLTPVSLLTDVLFLLFYVALLTAAEVEPHRRQDAAAGGGGRGFELAGSLFFAVALLGYFVLIPASADFPAYDTWVPSYAFYVCLDLYLAARFAQLRHAARIGRWRRVYGLLSVTALLWGLCDAIELLYYAGPLAQISAVWDALWWVPFLPLVLALRKRPPEAGEEEVAAEAERALAEAERAGPPATASVRRAARLNAFAIALPALHLSLHVLGLHRQPGHEAREILVLTSLIFLSCLAFLQQGYLQRRARGIQAALERSESDHRESEERYRRLVESSPDAIVVVRARRIAYLNPAARSLLEIPPEGIPDAAELMGRLEVLPPVPPPERWCRDPPTWTAPCRLRRADGETRSLELAFSTIPFQDGPAVQIIGRDVSETEKLRREAQRMEHLAGLGELSATVAHEIRNPLGAIKLNLHYVRDRLELPASLKLPWADVMEGVERIERTIRDILAFARPQPATLRQGDLNDLLVSCLRSLAPALREGDVAVEKVLDPACPEVLMDTGQMLRAFTNILDNARIATPPRGRITVRTRFEGQAITVEIADTGRGIAPQHLGRIFDPFFTTRSHGTGLGLAVVARTLEQHGCEVAVASRPGEGTTFTLRFPVPAAAWEPAAEAKGRAS